MPLTFREFRERLRRLRQTKRRGIVRQPSMRTWLSFEDTTAL